MASDRYEPLPPFTRLPALLWSRMGTAFRALTVLLVLGAVAAVAILAPRIADTKESNAARDRREAAEARSLQIRELRELVRPRTGTAAAVHPQPELERLITADARRRPDAGRILRTDPSACGG